MTAQRLRVPVLAASFAVAALTLAACSSSGSSPAAANTDPATAGAPASSPSASTPAQPAASGKPVTATETEFHIALSAKTLTAGTYTFRVKNAGAITHALTVDGPGVEDKSTGDLSPGGSTTLTVTLKAGSYDVYCPVGNHKMEGMDETVTVT